ncbi:MAG: hypothetical protein AB8B79_04935 [Granulosicoccus sp.]
MATNKNSFFDLQVPFFIPLWRRVAVIACCLAWSIVEFANDSPSWAFVFVAIGAFAAWQLLFSGWPENSQQENDQQD